MKNTLQIYELLSYYANIKNKNYNIFTIKG